MRKGTWATGAAGAILLCGIGFLLFCAGAVWIGAHLATWHDEAWSMATASAPLGELVQRSFDAEGQPPLYFLLLHGWLAIRPSIGFARGLSLAFTAGAIAVSLLAARLDARAAPGHVPLMAVTMLTSTFVMYVATEARGYGLQLLLGALTAWTLAQAAQRGRASNGHLAALVALGVCAAWVHYFAAIPIAAATMALVAVRVLSLERAAVVAALGLVGVAPLIPRALESFRMHTEASEGGALTGVGLLARALAEVMLPHGYGADPVLLLAPVLVVLAAALLLRTRRPAPMPTAGRAALTAAALVVLALLTLALLGGSRAAEARYLAAAAPLLWTAAFAASSASLGPARVALLVLPLCVMGVYRTASVYTGPVRVVPWRQIVRAIPEGQASPRTVFVFPPVEALTARAELPAAFQVVGFPVEFDGTRPTTARDFQATDDAALRRHVAAHSGGDPFWLVLETPAYYGPASVVGSSAQIQGWVARNCLTRSVASFPRRPGSDDITYLMLLSLGPAPAAASPGR